MSRIVYLDPKLTPQVNLSNFQAEEKFLILYILGRLNEKRAAATPWLINFAKICSEHVLKIKAKSHKVLAS